MVQRDLGVTNAEAARLAGIPESTMRDWSSREDWPVQFFMRGRRRLMKRAQFMQWLNEYRRNVG